MKTIELKIKGMACQGCVSAVRSAIAQVEGVHSATVDLSSKRAVVEVDDDLSEKSIIEAVSEGGYEAEIA